MERQAVFPACKQMVKRYQRKHTPVPAFFPFILLFTLCASEGSRLCFAFFASVLGLLPFFDLKALDLANAVRAVLARQSARMAAV